MTDNAPKIAFNPEAVARLYDDIADVYASYYTDYEAAVRKQGHDLAAILREKGPENAARVLDCSCGIGTQAIGLALQGFRMEACDISPKSIAEARKNAAAFGMDGIDFRVADMRHLSDIYAPGYDAVVSCGNSLAHLLTQEDIEAVLRGAYGLLNPGGVFLAALTDHETSAPRDETKFHDPHIKRHGGGGKTMNFQVWTWIVPGESYICDDYTLIDDAPNGAAVETKKVSAPFRIWRREKLFSLASAAGFSAQEWLLPELTGHHNPVLCLTR